MEDLEREDSQLRPPSTKRPWEEEQILAEKGNNNAWHSALLPPIDAGPYRRGATTPRGGKNNNEAPPKTNGPDSKNSNSNSKEGPSSKKTKFEGHDYNTFPRRIPIQKNKTAVPNGKTAAPSLNTNAIYTTQNRGCLDLESTKPNGRPAPGPANTLNGDKPADSHEATKNSTNSTNSTTSTSSSTSSNLCRRCRRLTVQFHQPSIGEPDSCDDCKRNPELAWVTQEAALWLSHLAETLSSGLSSEQRGILRGLDHGHSHGHGPPRSGSTTGTTGCPPMGDFGLKQTLNWLLGRIYYVNQLADQLVKQLPPASFHTTLNSSSSKDLLHRNGTKAEDAPPDIMKRRIDADSDDPFKSRDEADSSSDLQLHARRRSVPTSMLALANEELLPLSSQPDYLPSLPSMDGPLQRVSSVMNPPPTPNRQQLHSAPGRSLPSPTSLGFPSPSGPSYGIKNSQGVNLPPPSSLHPQQTSNSYLPSITATHSPDSALREHTAALQHEVSIQKIALSSLQGEHDKLLAAFSRSQTRATALAKKHGVSDTEVIYLTEEKLRLQAQVIELERDVEELARSRDGFRQAAVQEGAQYVEIVQRASRLEEMAGEEKKNWNKLKEDMEAKIQALTAGNTDEAEEVIRPARESPPASHPEDMAADTPASSSEGFTPVLKTEPLITGDARPTAAPTSHSHPSSPLLLARRKTESVEDLKAEIRRLQERCAEVENALRAIRNDSRSVEDIVKTILARADSTLES